MRIAVRHLPLTLALALVGTPVTAQQDRLASCPDPEAARQYVKECMSANPYNTREICEQRALEAICAGGATQGTDRSKQ